MSASVIPTLLKKGITGVSVGVNSGTSPPAVPKIFRWKYDEDNEVVAMWHPGESSNILIRADLLHPGKLYVIFVSKIWASTRENLSSGVCEQHRRRPACASAQSDQRLCYSLFEKYHI